jgi:hypothetical protein
VTFPLSADAGAAETPAADTVAGRLRRHARRLQLLADELQALALYDLPRGRALAGQRAALEAELAGDHRDGEPPEQAATTSADECAAAALALLKGEHADRAHARDEIDALCGDSVLQVRHLGARIRVAGVYRELAPPSEQLNVRL